MVSVILKIVLGEKIILAKKKKKFILNTPIFGQYCGITLYPPTNTVCGGKKKPCFAVNTKLWAGK